jgi:hypothetical protein
MKKESKEIERILRAAPRPKVPVHFAEKLKSEIHLSPPNVGSSRGIRSNIEDKPSRFLLILLGFLKANRFNLGGLGLAWTVILCCRITLPTSHESIEMASLNRRSPLMFVALADENHRLLFATLRFIGPEVEDPGSTHPKSPHAVQKKNDAG